MALPRKAKILSVGLLATVAIGSLVHLNRPESSAAMQSTDDAYVQADFTTVAPQVAGTVARVLAEDDQPVKAGDLLAVIDERDFEVARQAAVAQVSGAQAAIASLKAQRTRQDTAIRQAQAALAADEAAVALARAEQARYRNLAVDGSGTVQARQQAEAQLRIQLANHDRNQAGLLATHQQIAVLDADMERAQAALAQARAAQAAAELRLSYTRIVAPIDGTIGQKSVRTGAFVNVGQPLLAIVPLDAVYIRANFRETQLARVRAGQAVRIAVDALPGEVFTGKVESLGPASGVSYSAIAPQNATGNFTKIVQRLPVRISIDPGQPTAQYLRVGMSVRTAINVESGTAATAR